MKLFASRMLTDFNQRRVQVDLLDSQKFLMCNCCKRNLILLPSMHDTSIMGAAAKATKRNPTLQILNLLKKTASLGQKVVNALRKDSMNGTRVKKVAPYLNRRSGATAAAHAIFSTPQDIFFLAICLWLSILPISFIRLSDSAISSFGNSGKLLVAWKEVCIPKTECRICFGNTKGCNVSLLAQILGCR
ncbi:hypothetical protein M9H77_29498 [Catharanthus roseus]|uniref:Uncharacterized protein n=1 Tax=Catharanthus roseus TaxID=4058 RepID=A0ACB9ZVG3_CATRO|nr:hypothetical protein M9H77_29498 [Catharanthus roseus]